MLYDIFGNPLTRGFRCERNDIPQLVSSIYGRARVPTTAQDDAYRNMIDASVKAINTKPVVRAFRLIKRCLVETTLVLLLLSAIAPAYAGGHGGHSGGNHGHHSRGR